jgi:hypothetical protein
MIKKYREFLNESYQLILESDVIYSDRMKLALSKIDNPISKFILDIENKDLPVKSNFFDIPIDVNDKISFIPDRKAQEILQDSTEYVRFVGSGGGWLKHKDTNKSIFDKLGYVYEEGTEPFRPNSNNVGEVISKVTSETSGKTYAYVIFKDENTKDVIGQGVYNNQKLRYIDNRQKLVWSKNRQDVKIGKGIKALLDISDYKFTAQELEQFVNQFKATIDKLNDKFSYFELVKGDEIGHWYNRQNYYESSGPLGSSCMAGVPKRYFSIYMENPDVCNLLILKSKEDNTKIIGRALLWTLINGEKYLDRIYTVGDSDVQLFKDYAKENDWYVKYYNGSNADSYVINPKTGEKDTLETKVKIKKGEYDGYPYLDTFKYWHPDTGILSTSRETSDDYILESTGGDYISCESCDGSGRQTCYDCDGDGSRECYECDGSGYQECSSCEGHGEESCSYCDGEGMIEGVDGEETECSDCSGRGNVDCSDCDGRGRENCSDCDGDGSRECYNCDGDGRVDCGECN